MATTRTAMFALTAFVAFVPACREPEVVEPTSVPPSVNSTSEPDDADSVAQVTAVIDSLYVPAPDEPKPLTVDDVLKIQKNVRAMEHEYECTPGCGTVVTMLAAEIEAFGEAGWEVADRECRWVSQSGRQLFGRE